MPSLDYQFAITIRQLAGLLVLPMVLGFLSGVATVLFVEWVRLVEKRPEQ